MKRKDELQVLREWIVGLYSDMGMRTASQSTPSVQRVAVFPVFLFRVYFNPLPLVSSLSVHHSGKPVVPVI